MKVLIVDDDADSLKMLDALFKGKGYEVSVAVNGEDALERLKQEPMDLIISDILMPKMDGFQLCRAVKSDDALKRIPFVFYTATYTSEKDRDFALSLGASRFILKPTDPDQFIKMINELLAEGEQGLIPPGKISIEKENEYLREHQARLIRKLGDKISELEQSEERYRSLIACAGDAIITIDSAGVITSWNDAAEKIFGYEPEEIVGRHFSILVPEELRSEQEVLLMKLQEKKLIGSLETVRKTKDNVLIPVGISLSLMKDKQGKELGISAIIRDMSERKKTEQFVHDIFQSMGEGLAVIDRNYRILTANPAYCKMAGMGPEEIKGRLCHEVFHHRNHPCEEEGFACPVSVSFRTGGPLSVTHHHEGADREPVDVEVRSYPLKDRSGEINSVIEIVRDISSQKKLEAQLLQSQKMEAIGRLAGGVAHDFNNILTAIIGYGSIVLMKMRPDDPVRMDIDHILESANRAAALTHSLLAFSRKQVLYPRPIDLNEIIQRVEKFLRRIIGEDVELKTAIRRGELVINADSGQIEQVLMNLATNARDAMPQGGVFTIETDTVAVDDGYIRAHGVGTPGTYAVATVSDTGLGMDEETRKRIFEPFFTTKEQGRGTGLGLSIIYGIVQQHNGFVNVYSEPGQGTNFKIYLPVAQTPVESRQALEIAAPVGGNETILLAEDDETVRELSRAILTEMGYTVIAAGNGEDAVQKFSEHQDRIRLVILDVIMPKKTGVEVYDDVRMMRPEVKALFVSGYTADTVHIQRLLAEGQNFIQKPVSPTDFLKKVREILDRK